MARAKKDAKPKKKEWSLIEFNSGHALREIKVGDRIDVFKVPYKEKWKVYTGIIRKIIRYGALGAWCELERVDTGKLSIEYIYLGKIYSGYDNPFK